MATRHTGRPRSIAQRLGHECALARFQHRPRVTARQIANELGIDPSVLSRFENGQHPGWPQNIERIVAAYERCCELEPEDLWRRAICR